MVIGGLPCLQLTKILVEPVEACLPQPAILFHPARNVVQRRRLEPARTPLRVAPLDDEASFWSTFRCLETPGRLMSKGSASSVTVASPWASRARIARRVGSDEGGEGLAERVGVHGLT